MTRSSSMTSSGVDALSACEALEVEYASARIFRELLIPRLLVFSGAVAVTVFLVRLPWAPLLLVLGLDSGLIGFAIHRERHTHKRWVQGAQRLARSLRIQPQTGIRPTVQ
jgi:hypothetical protein